jgi:flagellar hook-associated protein 1
MRSTFGGFETIRTALNASQKGLDTTGQNIANVNTEGYSRQKLDLSPVSPDIGVDKYSFVASTNIGQGVNIDGVSQVRDSFLDARYTKQNSDYNALSTTESSLNDIENVFDEVTTVGLQAGLNDFYSQLQSLSSNPDSVEFSNLLRSSAQNLTEVLNQYSQQLSDIRDQQLSDLNVVVNDTNFNLKNISDLNVQIKAQLLNGDPANELKDQRNTYIDKISGYLNVTVASNEDGTVTIKSGDTTLLDGSNNNLQKFSVDSSTYPVRIKNTVTGDDLNVASGEIKAHLQVLNGKGAFGNEWDDQFLGIPYYQTALDSLTNVFAKTFNDLNSQDGTPKPLFEANGETDITAGNIKISSDWNADEKYITTTTQTPIVEGRNDNIIRMINAMNQDIMITPSFKGTFEEYSTSIMSDVASDVKYYTDVSNSSNLVLTSISNQRQSVMGVSLDEESINMIQYQKSYSAAARLMTTLDDALDTLINKMGTVGR